MVFRISKLMNFCALWNSLRKIAALLHAAAACFNAKPQSKPNLLSPPPLSLSLLLFSSSKANHFCLLISPHSGRQGQVVLPPPEPIFFFSLSLPCSSMARQGRAGRRPSFLHGRPCPSLPWLATQLPPTGSPSPPCSNPPWRPCSFLSKL
jgi:hypothetical protein